MILWLFLARGVSARWERAWWTLASAARESRASEAVDLRACAFGSGACTLGSVDASTLAWLSASICPRVCACVFMFEASAEPSARPRRRRRRRRAATVWVSAADAISTSPRRPRRGFGRRRKVRRRRILQLFQLAEWWSRRPSSSRRAAKKEMQPHNFNLPPRRFLFFLEWVKF